MVRHGCSAKQQNESRDLTAATVGGSARFMAWETRQPDTEILPKKPLSLLSSCTATERAHTDVNN